MESTVQSENSKAVNYAAIYNHEYSSNPGYAHPNVSPGLKLIQRQSHIIQKWPREQRLMALDVGCGVGHVARYLGGYYDSVYGCDISKEAIAKAVDLHKGHGLGFIEGTVTKLPYQPNQFDLVTCFDVLEHLVERDILLARAELMRVRKRGQAILISVSTRPSASQDIYGMNLHRTVRPVSWWKDLFRPDYTEFDRRDENLVMWMKTR